MRPLPPDFTDPFVGTQYRTVGILGEGAMGLVLAVEHRVTNQPLAAKVLQRELAASEAFVDRFVLEAEMMASMEHPNVVRVFDLGETPSGDRYYIMERLSGRTLGDEVRQGGPLLPMQALIYAREVASALVKAHEKGIVHRDLKPDNVFLVQERYLASVKLLDFGVAKVVSTDKGIRKPLVPTTQGMVGSPRFMAPEVVVGQPADARSDIYSLGLLMHFMLRGALPFSDVKGIEALCKAQVERQPEALDPTEIKPILIEFVRVATAKQPDERFQTMIYVERALGFIEDAERSGVRLDRLPEVFPPREGVDGKAPAGQSKATDPRAPVFAGGVFALGFAVGIVIIVLLMLLFPALASLPPRAPTPIVGALEYSAGATEGGSS